VGEGISGNSWWGVPCLVLRFLTLFETNTSNANVREYLPGILVVEIGSPAFPAVFRVVT